MAKVAFSKLKCKVNDTEVPVQIGEETIMVKQYLPIQEKLVLIGYIVQLAHDQDYSFCNPVKLQVFRELEMIFAYTNLNFTDKQKEDLAKLYDQLASSDVLSTVINAIPESEKNMIECGVDATAAALYQYQNSALGILDTIKENFEDSALDLSKLSEEIMDPEALDLIKAILTKTS